MNEKDLSSISDDNSLKDIDITINEADQFRNILINRDFVTIHINSLIPNYININNHSFVKINKLLQSYPEDNVVFLYNKKVLVTATNSFRLSRNSMNCSRNNNSSLSDSFNNEKLKHVRTTREEIINTDIRNPKPNNKIFEKILFKSPINIQSSIEKEVIREKNGKNTNNNKDDNVILNNNMKNLQKFNNNNMLKNNNKNSDRKVGNKNLIIFKWLYHFYLIVGICLLLHYISFIFSEYNSFFYKFICFLLIICLIYIGYIGIKNENSNNQNIFFNGDNIFWTNFFIFILTIISFIGLAIIGGYFEFIKSQGFFGYLICLIYIITLIVEAIYVIYYDVIIEEIFWEKTNNSENNKNNLNIQLVDVN